MKAKVILYVDDDPDDREFLAQAVLGVNPDVQFLEAENGLVALERLQALKNETLPCLIVLDLNMPLLDGHETFRRLRIDEALCRVPVIIYSSSEKPFDKEHFTSLGVEFFTKPTDMSYLRSIAHHMVDVCC